MDIDKLQARLRLEVEARDDASDRVDELRIDLHKAEEDLPPPAGVKPVGRQVQTGNLGVKEMLVNMKALLVREAGGALTSELSTDFDIHATAFMDMHQERVETKMAKTAQEAEDAKLAFQEQAKELNFQIGHKHGRSDPTNDFRAMT